MTDQTPAHDSPDTTLTRPQHARIEAANRAYGYLKRTETVGRGTVDPSELMTLADWILDGRHPLEEDLSVEKISGVVVHTNEHDPNALRHGIEYRPGQVSGFMEAAAKAYLYDGGEDKPTDASGSMVARSRYEAEAIDAFVQCGAVDGTRVCVKRIGHKGQHQTETTPDGVAAQWDDPPAETSTERTPGQIAFVAMVGEPWDSISSDHQAAWESAAAAVITWHENQQTKPDPDVLPVRMPVRVGDRDWTPDNDGYCDAEDEGYWCSRGEHDDGQHAAGDGDTIAHVWTDTTPASGVVL